MMKQRILNREGILFFLIAMFAVFSLSLFAIYFVSSPDNARAVSSPSDVISENKIVVYPDRVIIFVENASLSSYAPTGSMTPIFSENSNGVRIKPASPEDVLIGDIISYEKDGILIVHRVVEKGEDAEGIYFVVKGDNNSEPDGTIRFQDIRYKTVAILY